MLHSVCSLQNCMSILENSFLSLMLLLDCQQKSKNYIKLYNLNTLKVQQRKGWLLGPVFFFRTTGVEDMHLICDACTAAFTNSGVEDHCRTYNQQQLLNKWADTEWSLCWCSQTNWNNPAPSTPATKLWGNMSGSKNKEGSTEIYHRLYATQHWDCQHCSGTEPITFCTASCSSYIQDTTLLKMWGLGSLACIFSKDDYEIATVISACYVHIIQTSSHKS